MSGSYVPSKGSYITCPYNIAHTIAPDRMQWHLTRCRKQNATVERTQCPFNATHLVPGPEFQYHMNHCPDRDLVDRYFVDSRKLEHQPHGNLSTPSYHESANAHVPSDGEDWDNEDNDVTHGYNPQKAIMNRDVYRKAQGGGKSTRKQFKRAEIERHSMIERGEFVDSVLSVDEMVPPTPEEAPKLRVMVPLRKPKEVPGVISRLEQVKLNPSMGMARGQALTNSVRAPPGFNSSTNTQLIQLARGIGSQQNQTDAVTAPIGRGTSAVNSAGDGRGISNLENFLARVAVKPVGESSPAFGHGLGRGRGAMIVCYENGLNRVNQVAEADEEDSPVSETEIPISVKKEVRKLERKLRQIEELIRQKEGGRELGPEEQEKISKKTEFQNKLAELKSQLENGT